MKQDNFDVREWQLYQMFLNESEEEEDFSVEAPKEWGIKRLGIGDEIKIDYFIDGYEEEMDEEWPGYMDMFRSKNEIFKIKNDNGYWEVSIWNPNEGTKTYDLEGFNEYLDGYEIEDIEGEDLSESEEEDFNVEAPPEWNITELGIGDILDSSNMKMQDPMKKFEIADFKVSLFPWENNSVTLKVFQLKDEPIPDTNTTTKQWKYIRNIFVDIETLNDRLKDGYKIIPSLRENEEEDFSVEAPPEWNVTDLGVGDTITPDMWDDNHHGYGFGFIGTFVHEPIKIVGFDEDSEGKFVKLQKLQSTWQKIRNKQNDIVEFDISEINDELKSQFRLVYPTNETKLNSLLETDDEWSVEAPPEWNIPDLKVGSIITPDMWDTSDSTVYWNLKWKSNVLNKKHKIKDIQTFKDNGKLERILIFTDGTRKWAGLLKPEYQQWEYTIDESDDEWSVEAPPEWNIADLEVGGVVTPDMWMANNAFKKYTDYLDKPHTIEKIEKMKLKGKKFYLLRFTDGSSEWSYMLKPEYQRVKGEDIFESEDDINEGDVMKNIAKTLHKKYDKKDVLAYMKHTRRYSNDKNNSNLTQQDIIKNFQSWKNENTI